MEIEGIEQPNKKSDRMLAKMDSYKYLGILDGDKIKERYSGPFLKRTR